ncbi:hypothetical protein N7931_09140 [Catenovulum sp. 2E275]|uniref:hypothetical protein n=1 Tax=Catenovulum sp. 2E275 TaxID=2980497 RepID=UPI0021CE7811|nr:hypothetical protein [Catenovulum sp. 2E275]MCU4675797.1 hypothetical protein [Catenovulum sp. 2E275]
MGILTKVFIILSCFVFVSPAFAVSELLIVTAKTHKIELTRQQIKQLYLGARLSIDGMNLQPLALPVGNKWRTVFNTKVMGLNEARIQSYWAQMNFTGRRTAPAEINTVNKLVENVLAIPGTLAYLPDSQVDISKFHIVYRVGIE